MSTMIAVAGRMAPTMKLTNARIPPRRLRLFVRLIPKNPNRKANDKHQRVRVSATFRNPPHQPKEKPVATKPNVAKNIAKSDIQSKESLLCSVREITESERRNNRLSMAGPATTANPRRFNGRRTRCTRRSSVKNVDGAGFHSPVGDSSATTLATGMRITTGSRVSLGSNSFGASNSDRSTSCIFFLPQRTDTPPVLRL